MKNFFLVLILLLCGFDSFGMEQANINKWQDVYPFAGKIVAYKLMRGDSYNLTGAYFPLQADDPSLIFAIVEPQPSLWWESGGYGFDVNRLIYTNKVGSNCALIDEVLSEYPLIMRIASLDEKKQIKKILDENKARFAYPFHVKERVLKLLQ